MAKMPKKVEDWKAPWDGGEIDPDKAKQFAFKLAQNAEAAVERAEAAETALQEEQAEHEKTRARATELEDKDKTEVEKLRAEVERLKTKPNESGKKGKTPLEIAMEVGDENGLSTAEIRRLAGRIRGDNDAALKADAEAFVDEFELGSKRTKKETNDSEADDDGDDGSDGADDAPVSRRPRVDKARGGSGSDRDSGAADSMESIRKSMPPRR